MQYPELAYEVSNGQTLCDKCRVAGMLDSWANGELKNKNNGRNGNGKRKSGKRISADDRRHNTKPALHLRAFG